MFPIVFMNPGQSLTICHSKVTILRKISQVSYHLFGVDSKGRYNQGIAVWVETGRIKEWNTTERPGYVCTSGQCSTRQQSNSTENVQPYQQMVLEYLAFIYKSKNKNLIPALHIMYKTKIWKPSLLVSSWTQSCSRGRNETRNLRPTGRKQGTQWWNA